MHTKKLIGALFLGLVAACGGGSGGGGPVFVDAAPPSDSTVVPPTCNPLTQTGCNAGEKCTWWTDQDNPPIGHVGCSPDGTTAIGQACTDPPAGPMGYDSCVKGSVCLSGECKQICDVNNGGAPMCDQNHACTRYADFFETNGMSVAGVCDPACDPLTQDLKVGATTAACGSPMATMPSKGCYGFDEFSCAPAGMASWPLTDRMMPRTNSAGNPYLNGCAPGFMPFFYEMTGSTKTLCSGLCAALETNNTGPLMNNADGDATAVGKLPTANKAAGDATCAIGKKGSRASSECHFIYPYVADDQGELLPAFENGPLLDTLGVCMAIEYFKYDADNDMTPETQYPGCASLPPRSAATPGENDDWLDWPGCAKLSTLNAGTPMMAPAPGSTQRANIRYSNGALNDVRAPKNAPMQLIRHNLQ